MFNIIFGSEFLEHMFELKLLWKCTLFWNKHFDAQVFEQYFRCARDRLYKKEQVSRFLHGWATDLFSELTRASLQVRRYSMDVCCELPVEVVWWDPVAATACCGRNDAQVARQRTYQEYGALKLVP